MHFVFIFVPVTRTKQPMDKPTTKKNNYNSLILNRLIEKYGLSKRFITMSLSGHRESDTSDTIKNDYSKMLTAVINLLKEL